MVLLGAEPSICKPTSPSRSDITAENICNEESLLEARVEESFLPGINFFIVLISFQRALQSILCACFLCHRCCIFYSSPSSLSFRCLFLIPTLFPEAVAICTRSQDQRRYRYYIPAASPKARLLFEFVNTSNIKPSNLRAHFIHTYCMLDTLPNHYY